MTNTLAREQKHAREREFFNSQAQKTKIEPVREETFRRYTGYLSDLHHAEFRMKLLGDVRGKRILNVGCGEGSTCVLLAMMGAQVTGIDIAEEAIAVANQRAAVNGMQGRCNFICAPIEETTFVEKFDIVLVESLLHHVIADLDTVVSGLVRACGGRLVMSEPVNLCGPLRRLRLALGTPEATEDERPLEMDELNIVGKQCPGLKFRTFRILTRLSRYVLKGSYESTTGPRKWIYDALVYTDAALLRLPFGSRLGSFVVMWADY